MWKKGTFIIISILWASASVFAHGSVPYIFNLPTCRTPGKRILNFDNGHRYFDPVKHTTNVNIAFSYGITDSFDVSIAHSYKNMDSLAAVKYSIMRDDIQGRFPVSLALTAGAGYKGDSEDAFEQDDQASWYAQFIVQKHLFDDRMSIGVVPHFSWNTNFYSIESNHDYSTGAGVFAEFYIFDRVSVCAEVIMNLYGFAFTYMNYNAGIKYAGYRHTFSLWVSNSSGYSPVEYVVGNTVLEPRPSFAFTREFDL